MADKKLYTVISLYGGHFQLPSGAYLEPAGSPGGRDRSYPVEIPEGHILWKLANPTDGSAPEIKIVEGDATRDAAPAKPAPPPPPKPVEATPPPPAPSPAPAPAAAPTPVPPAESVEAASTGVREMSEEELEAATAPEAPAPAEAEEALEDELPADDEMSGVLEGLGKDAAPAASEAPQNIRGKKRNRR